MLKRHFLSYALSCSAPSLKAAIYTLPFAPYAPIRRQVLTLVRAINKKRKEAALSLLPYDCVRMQRMQVKPFAPVEALCQKAA